MRRAEAPFTIQMIVSLALLFVVCASIAGLIMYHINIAVDDKKARADILVERLLSREGILIVDPLTDRVMLNEIDPARLSLIDQRDWGYAGTLSARITLEGQEYFVDRPRFVRDWPLLQAGLDREKAQNELTGVGLDVPLMLPDGALRYKIPVNIRSNIEMRKDILEVLVVVASE